MDSKKDAEKYDQEGRSAEQKKQFKRAIVNFTRAIKLDRNNWTNFFEVGLSFAKQEEYNKACSFYKNALVMNPQESLIYFNLGTTLQTLGKIEESIEMYRQALHLNLGDAEAHYNLAIILTTKEKYEEAQRHFVEVLKLDYARAFMVYNCLGYSYLLQGEFAKAISEFQKAIGSKEKYTRAYCNLSLVLFCENRNQEAEDVFDEGMKMLEEGESKIKVLKGITESYSREKVRLETKLNNNEEIMAEEKMTLLKTLVNGLVNILNLFSQQRNPKKEKRFLWILARVPEEHLDLYEG